METPNIIHVNSVIADNTEFKGRDGKYYPARPLPFYSIGRRWKAAWLVFTGRADALLWEQTNEGR